MGQSNSDTLEESSASEPHCIDTLRELTRHGYVPDPASPETGGSILLRHPSGPDLMLRGNGTFELPPRQLQKSAAAAPAGFRRPAWRIGLLIVLALAVYTFVSLALVSTIISY
jgi:hypothetical protein